MRCSEKDYITRAYNVNFRYSGSNHNALNNVNVTCKPGEVTLLCGGSGCGKTSVIRLFNGLIPNFHSGDLQGEAKLRELSIPEKQLYQLAPYCSTVFQNPKMQFYTTEVRQEMAFALENLGIDRDRIIERIDKVAKELDIEDLLYRNTSQLSGGQMQRVACGVALTTETPVIIFDEPTANLSLDGIEKLTKLIKRLKEEGRTVIIAEHRIWFLRGIVDKVYYFNNGNCTDTFEGDEFFCIDDNRRRELGLRTLIPIKSRAKEKITGDGLIIENLRFGYKRNREILNIPRMVFPKGKITALVGENGIGKTTLGRLICKLEKSWKGRITLDGKKLKKKDAYIILQEPGHQLFSDYVEDEILLGLSKDEKEEIKAEEILSEVDLADYKEAHPQALSGGQRQRLAIATAMTRKSKVYVFDEPTSGVGYNHLVSISKIMRRLADSGSVVIVITHDQELIEETCDFVETL